MSDTAVTPVRELPITAGDEEGGEVPVSSKKTGGHRGRSAITGRFVKQAAVKRSPRTTVNESAKKKRN
jgi:hypothetical protein